MSVMGWRADAICTPAKAEAQSVPRRKPRPSAEKTRLALLLGTPAFAGVHCFISSQWPFPADPIFVIPNLIRDLFLQR